MAHLYGLIALLFLFPLPAQSAKLYYCSNCYGVSTSARFISSSAVCGAYQSAITAGNPSRSYSLNTITSDAANTGGTCVLNEYNSLGTLLGTKVANWGTTSGPCPSGTVESGGVCVVPDPCELLADMCSGSQGMSTNFSLPGRKTGVSFTCMAPTAIGTNDPLPGCTKGCMAQVGGFTTAFQDNSGSWVTTGSAKYSGATCDPSVINDLNAESDPEYEPEENPTTTDKSDPSCPNGFKGTVNGVSVCVPPKASSGVTEMESKDNGDGTKTDSKTEVKCENGKCEVTKTSTTTNTQTGSTVNSSSVTTTVDKATYCSQNKTAGACKDEKGENEDGNGSFTGNCDSGFQCKGDAITCAIAKKQHGDYCEALKSPEHAAYVAAKAITGKVTGDLPGNQTINLMDRFSSGDDFIGAGSCPPDRSISLLYGELVIPYSQLCPWFSILGNIMVVVSCIAGARIIVGRYS